MMTKSEMRRIACTNPTKIVEENEKLRAQLAEARELIEDLKGSTDSIVHLQKARAYLEKYK